MARIGRCDGGCLPGHAHHAAGGIAAPRGGVDAKLLDVLRAIAGGIRIGDILREELLTRLEEAHTLLQGRERGKIVNHEHLGKFGL